MYTRATYNSNPPPYTKPYLHPVNISGARQRMYVKVCTYVCISSPIRSLVSLSRGFRSVASSNSSFVPLCVEVGQTGITFVIFHHYHRHDQPRQSLYTQHTHNATLSNYPNYRPWAEPCNRCSKSSLFHDQPDGPTSVDSLGGGLCVFPPFSFNLTFMHVYVDYMHTFKADDLHATRSVGGNTKSLRMVHTTYA